MRSTLFYMKPFRFTGRSFAGGHLLRRFDTKFGNIVLGKKSSSPASQTSRASSATTATANVRRPTRGTGASLSTSLLNEVAEKTTCKQAKKGAGRGGRSKQQKQTLLAAVPEPCVATRVSSMYASQIRAAEERQQRLCQTETALISHMQSQSDKANKKTWDEIRGYLSTQLDMQKFEAEMNSFFVDKELRVVTEDELYASPLASYGTGMFDRSYSSVGLLAEDAGSSSSVCYQRNESRFSLSDEEHQKCLPLSPASSIPSLTPTSRGGKGKSSSSSPTSAAQRKRALKVANKATLRAPSPASPISSSSAPSSSSSPSACVNKFVVDKAVLDRRDFHDFSTMLQLKRAACDADKIASAVANVADASQLRMKKAAKETTTNHLLLAAAKDEGKPQRGGKRSSKLNKHKDDAETVPVTQATLDAIATAALVTPLMALPYAMPFSLNRAAAVGADASPTSKHDDAQRSIIAAQPPPVASMPSQPPAIRLEAMVSPDLVATVKECAQLREERQKQNKRRLVKALRKASSKAIAEALMLTPIGADAQLVNVISNKLKGTGVSNAHKAKKNAKPRNKRNTVNNCRPREKLEEL